MKFYSPSKNAFYAPEFQADYEAAGNWPDDLVEVTADTYDALQAQIQVGKQIAPDSAGNPISVSPPSLPFGEQQAAAIRKIDADVDAIYGAIIGNRQAEYDLAESDASAYKTAGYSGMVPASVQSWATAKKQTAKWAADDILATSANWRAAQADIRANRLVRKEDVRNAADPADVAAVLDTWSAYVKKTRESLGI